MTASTVDHITYLPEPAVTDMARPVTANDVREADEDHRPAVPPRVTSPPRAGLNSSARLPPPGLRCRPGGGTGAASADLHVSWVTSAQGSKPGGSPHS